MDLRGKLALGALGAAWLASCGEETSAPPAPPPSGAPAIATSAPPASPPPGACALRRPGRLARVSTGASAELELAAIGGTTVLLVADLEGRAVHAIATEARKQVSVTDVAGQAGHVLALSTGHVAVTLRDTSEVALFEPGERVEQALELRCKVKVPAEPWGLAEVGSELWVTSGYGGAVTVLSTADLATVASAPLPREPRAIAYDAARKRVFVSHAVGGVLSALPVPLDPAKLQRVDLARDNHVEPDELPVTQSFSRRERRGEHLARLREIREKTPTSPLLAPRPASASYVLAVHDGRVVIPAISVQPRLTATVTPTYGQSSPVATDVITVDARSLVPVFGDLVVRDEPRCVLTRGLAVGGGRLYRACLDDREIGVFDATVAAPAGARIDSLVVGAAPSALALEEKAKRLWVLQPFAGQVLGLDVGAKLVEPAPIRLWRRVGSATPEAALVARGRELFHTSEDVRLSRRRPCASCHPDGRDDGLVWATPRGLRQTPTLAGRIPSTKPYGWNGESKELWDHLAQTFERLGGVGLAGDVVGPKGAEDLRALTAYLESLALPAVAATPSPGGKAVFERLGCAGCHPGGGADGQVHDVGTGAKGERTKFDTPTLRGIARSAPYLHDGRHATLDAFLRSTDTSMIDGKALSDADRALLLAYLESL